MNRKLRRRDVVLGAAAVAACGKPDGPLAQWPEGNKMPQPSAIPQNVQLAKPWNSSLYDPLVLFADTTLSTGAAISPNTAALINPHALPMELLGVKFRIHTLNTEPNASGEFPPGTVNGLGIGVKMDMGELGIVDAGVPVSLLSNARDDSEDSELGYYVFTQPASMMAGFSPIASVYDYFWRLQYPLYIPPAAGVTPLFSHLTQTPFDVKIGVTYYCRVRRESQKQPAFVQVPWVTKYLSKSFEIASGVNDADSDQSSEMDIRNPFPNARVEIQRITGRVNYYRTGSGTTLNTNYERGYAAQINSLLRMQMRSSRGDEIIQTPTLFGLVFAQSFKSWEVGNCWFMQPNEYYKVRLTRDTFTNAFVSPDTARMQVGVGVVGYRKLNTSTLEGAL